MNDEYLNYAGGDEKFADWLRRLDQLADHFFGASIFDLVDYSWRDVYESGDDPQQALRDAVADGLLE